MAWLDQLTKPFRADAAPAFAMGAFGKHPGWDDHLDDFGLETEALLAARQLLYVQGIGGLIDAGAWENSAAGEAPPPFGHVCFWFSEPDLLVTRLWASQDRKGRSRYPMVVCAHAANVEARAAIGRILPDLEAVERECRAATTAEAVHGLLADHRERLRPLISAPPLPYPPPSFAKVATQLGLTAQNESWQRIVYAAESQLAAFGPGKVPDAAKRITMKMSALPAMAQQMRLPVGEASAADAALFWHALFTKLLGTTAPMLFLHPLDDLWIDVIVGCPGVKQLVCLRASGQTIPLVQEVPYNLPPEFREKAAHLFQELAEERP